MKVFLSAISGTLRWLVCVSCSGSKALSHWLTDCARRPCCLTVSMDLGVQEKVDPRHTVILGL